MRSQVRCKCVGARSCHCQPEQQSSQDSSSFVVPREEEVLALGVTGSRMQTQRKIPAANDFASVLLWEADHDPDVLQRRAELKQLMREAGVAHADDRDCDRERDRSRADDRSALKETLKILNRIEADRVWLQRYLR